jgi:hypothetical protein
MPTTSTLLEIAQRSQISGLLQFLAPPLEGVHFLTYTLDAKNLVDDDL